MPSIRPWEKGWPCESKNKIETTLKRSKQEMEKNGRQIKGHEADNVLFDIVSDYLNFWLQ